MSTNSSVTNPAGTQVQVVDLTGAEGPHPGSEILTSLRTAAETTGAVLVTNHGVPLEEIETFEAKIGALLARPREDKVSLASPTGHPYRGWRQWPDDFGRLELERYMVARFDDAEEARRAGVAEEHLEIYRHKNVWPPDDPGFKEVLVSYRAHVIALAKRVLGLYAVSLGLAPTAFPTSGLDSTSVTVNNYPTWLWPDAPEDDEKLLLLEHADGNAITVLHQKGSYEGLQIQGPDGAWLPVPVIHEALIVLSGGNLARWTNDRFVPGRHRVVAGGEASRQSTAFFYNPSLETVVQPIAELVATGDEPHYEPYVVAESSQNQVDDYLSTFGRPAQVEAWRTGTRYVAEVVGSD